MPDANERSRRDRESSLRHVSILRRGSSYPLWSITLCNHCETLSTAIGSLGWNSLRLSRRMQVLEAIGRRVKSPRLASGRTERVWRLKIQCLMWPDTKVAFFKC